MITTLRAQPEGIHVRRTPALVSIRVDSDGASIVAEDADVTILRFEDAGDVVSLHYSPWCGGSYLWEVLLYCGEFGLHGYVYRLDADCGAGSALGSVFAPVLEAPTNL